MVKKSVLILHSENTHKNCTIIIFSIIYIDDNTNNNNNNTTTANYDNFFEFELSFSLVHDSENVTING